MADIGLLISALTYSVCWHLTCMKLSQSTPYEEVFLKESFSKNLYLHTLDGRGAELTNGATEGYDGFQRLNSVYAMFDVKPLRQIRLIGGMRAEINDQNIYNYNRTADGFVRELTNYSQTDWLPSVNAIYSITDKINVRAASV